MRVLMITRLIDRENSLYSGYTHRWIESLAARVTHLDVICQFAGSMKLPDNVSVTVVRGEQRVSTLRLLLAFQRTIWSQMRKVDVVFAHPSPTYALAAAPGAKLFGIPLVEWYTSGNVKPTLRLAHVLVDLVVTASPESYRLPSTKVTVLGHGVDFDHFVPRTSLPADTAHGRQVLSVGVLTDTKDVETQIDAAALLLQRPDFDEVLFKVAGDEPHFSRGHRARLEARIEDRGLGGRFLLVGGVPYSRIVRFYQSGTILVSTSRTGGIDKVPLEAMGCALPTLVTGSAYAQLLGEERSLLLAREGDAPDLADKMAHLLSMSPAELRNLGLKLRERARQEHDLGTLMDNLVRVFREVAKRDS